MSKKGNNDADSAGPDAAARFADLVEVRVRNRDFLSLDDETALLEEGVKTYGLPLAQARGIILDVAENNDTALAREIEKGVEQWVKTAAGRNKKLGRKQFNEMVTAYENGSSHELSAADCQKRVKTLMERNDVQPKRAGLTMSKRWYNKI